MSNRTQVGGDHYEPPAGAQEHWDRIYAMYGRGYFVGSATKYIERAHLKGGAEDLKKAISFINKLIELEYGPQPAEPTMTLQQMIAAVESQGYKVLVPSAEPKVRRGRRT